MSKKEVIKPPEDGQIVLDDNIFEISSFAAIQ